MPQRGIAFAVVLLLVVPAVAVTYGAFSIATIVGEDLPVSDGPGGGERLHLLRIRIHNGHPGTDRLSQFRDARSPCP